MAPKTFKVRPLRTRYAAPFGQPLALASMVPQGAQADFGRAFLQPEQDRQIVERAGNGEDSPGPAAKMR